ncbi:MAG: hypothetical protein ACSHX4_00135 [Opitutaceae bacterium]
MLSRYTSAQKFSVVGIFVGAAWVYLLLLQPVIFDLPKSDDWVDAVLRLAMSLAFATPGILLIVCGLRLFRQKPTRSSIKNAMGLLVSLSACFLVFGISSLFTMAWGEWGNGFSFGIVVFVSVALVLPVYARLSRWVMEASNVVPLKGEFIGRGCYQILAVFLWMTLSNAFGDPSRESEANDILLSIQTFGPILVAYLSYKLAVRLWVRDTFAVPAALDYASVVDSDESSH